MSDDADKVCDNVPLTNLIKGLQYSVNKQHCEQTGRDNGGYLYGQNSNNSISNSVIMSGDIQFLQ